MKTFLDSISAPTWDSDRAPLQKPFQPARVEALAPKHSRSHPQSGPPEEPNFLLSNEARIGICCNNIGTRALLRRAAHEASIPSTSLDFGDAIQWLETHPAAFLLVQATSATTEQLQLELACHPQALSRQAVFLQITESQDTWPMGLTPPRTRPLPAEPEAAFELIVQLLAGQQANETPENKLLATAKRVAQPAAAPMDEGLDTSSEAYDMGRQLAPFPIDLLLVGETGSGKDSLAKFIFQQSGSAGSFVPINCAAIPEHLAEAELFGFEAGSFTGAARAKPGKFEDADKGVLYLDEVDSCPLWLQAKLLRVLQDKGSERLGSSKFRPSDFRLIASTKANLPSLVAKGLFREDLYFRLNVIEIHLPSLRERPARLQALFQRFVREACQRFGLPHKVVDAETLSGLMQNMWVGNIRELKSSATRYVLPFCQDSKSSAQEKASLRDALDACERGLILSTLARTKGNVNQAASDLCLPMNTLYYRMKRLNISQKHSG